MHADRQVVEAIIVEVAPRERGGEFITVPGRLDNAGCGLVQELVALIAQLPRAAAEDVHTAGTRVTAEAFIWHANRQIVESIAIEIGSGRRGESRWNHKRHDRRGDELLRLHANALHNR